VTDVRAARLTLIGSIVGVIGVALLLVEASPAVVRHSVLSSTSQLLMWIGVGVAAVGGILLVCGAWLRGTDEFGD
jgi:protein-S-isoprenylcysteine O-methyltransferase Ste14